MAPLYRAARQISRINVGARRFSLQARPGIFTIGTALACFTPARMLLAMRKEVVIPRLGSSDESDLVKVLRWIKQPGERVREGEPLLEVETDKVNVEIEAPAAVRLVEIRAQAGSEARFNAVVGIIESED